MLTHNSVLALVQSDTTSIELAIIVSPSHPLEVGSIMHRDAKLHPGTWMVIKIFTGKEKKVLEAVLTLAGEDALKTLFKIERTEEIPE